MQRGQRKLSESNPDIFAELVGVEGGLDARLDEIPYGSGVRCRWRCGRCSSEWVATPNNRTNGGGRTWCAPCRQTPDGKARARAAGWRPGRRVSRPIVAERPGLADVFIEVKGRPDLAIADLGMQSEHVAVWKCKCGSLVEVAVVNAAKALVLQCLTCRPRARSLLELEVARLLRLATGVEVLVDVTVPMPSGPGARVDLSIPALGWLIDLDPHMWHGGDERRDERKSVRLVGLNYHRIRQSGLGAVSGCLHPVGSRHAWDWALALRNELMAAGVPFATLSPEQVAAEATAAKAEWVAMAGGPPAVNALTVAPHLADEYVTNLSRPGLGLEYATRNCRDRALWHCSTCAHEWEARIGHRVVAGSGCPRCANGRKGQWRT